MPKTRLQEFAFTILMTFAMVYVMTCFNIVASMGTIESGVFSSALAEMPDIWPVAIAIDMLVVSRASGKVAIAAARNSVRHLGNVGAPDAPALDPCSLPNRERRARHELLARATAAHFHELPRRSAW